MHVPSLRQLARHTKYAVSSLHEAKSAGHFGEEAGGGYDLAAVCRGLLANSSPRAERRAFLESLAASGGPGASQQSRPDGLPTFDPVTEQRIKASHDLFDEPEVQEAFEILGALPYRMLRAYCGDSKPAHPLVAESAFLESVTDRLKQYVDAIRAEREAQDPNAELIDEVAVAVGKKKQLAKVVVTVPRSSPPQ